MYIIRALLRTEGARSACESAQPSFRRAAIGRNAFGLLRQFESKLGRAATLERPASLKSLLDDLPCRYRVVYRDPRFASSDRGHGGPPRFFRVAQRGRLQTQNWLIARRTASARLAEETEILNDPADLSCAEDRATRNFQTAISISLEIIYYAAPRYRATRYMRVVHATDNWRNWCAMFPAAPYVNTESVSTGDLPLVIINALRI